MSGFWSGHEFKHTCLLRYTCAPFTARFWRPTVFLVDVSLPYEFSTCHFVLIYDLHIHSTYLLPGYSHRMVRYCLSSYLVKYSPVLKLFLVEVWNLILGAQFNVTRGSSLCHIQYFRKINNFLRMSVKYDFNFIKNRKYQAWWWMCGDGAWKSSLLTCPPSCTSRSLSRDIQSIGWSKYLMQNKHDQIKLELLPV